MKQVRKKKKAPSPIKVVGTVLLVLGLLVILSALIVSKFDLHRLSPIHYETKIYDITEDFQTVKINTKNAGISVLSSPDGSCRLECDEAKSIFYNVFVENGTLNVAFEDTREWYEKIASFSFLPPKVTLYLPSQSYDALFLESNTGSIHAELPHTFSHIELSGTSGDVTCHASAQNKIVATTTSGDVKIFDSTATACNASSASGKVSLWDIEAESITVSAQSGDVRLSEINANEIAANARTGKITVIDTEADATLRVETTSGKIILRRADAPAIDIKTVSGKVTGTLLSDKLFDVRSDKGQLTYPSSRGSETCTVRTNSGSVKLEIAD